MLFYRIDGNLLNWLDEDERRNCVELQSRSDAFYRRRKSESYMFVSRGSVGCLIAGLITNEKIPPEELAEEFLRMAKLNAEDMTATEITLKEMSMLLRSADMRDYIADDDDVLICLGLRDICRQYGVNYTEKMIPGDDCTAQSLAKEAKKQLWNQTLCPEIERIFMGSRISNATGHPVHYIVSSDSREKRKEVSELLLRALRANNRLSSGRICMLHSFDNIEAVEHIYQKWTGGTVIINCRDEDNRDSSFSSRTIGEMNELCAVAGMYRNSVLTIFWLPGSDERTKSIVLDCMGNTPMVELSENIITLPEAKAYLRRLARQNGVPLNQKLYSITGQADTALTIPALEQHFSDWLGSRLRTAVYPQYASICACSANEKTISDHSNALSELNSMVGLEEAKRVINRALCYYRAQLMFAHKGMASGKTAMHMVFTGNPGTAKTTVARLFAQIMKEHGLLTSGELVEVGRADLVGKYVGWTAKIVKNCFHKARGGVLFIDEAYSLVDSKEGMYGDEAINTIVQEMENHRDDVIVIFAGYPDKMESFLRRNPGLRSRIAFHVPFSDYTPEELCDISAHIAGAKGFSLSPGARERLLSVFESAVLTEDFGNGRFARNVIEQAQMEQAVRLVSMDYDSVTRSDVSTLLAEDITCPPAAEKTRVCIGF